MKKVYVLFNTDVSEIILATEDQTLAEEVMMDAFMEDVFYQWYWEQQHRASFDPYRDAKEIWDDILYWYNDYVYIFESEVV